MQKTEKYVNWFNANYSDLQTWFSSKPEMIEPSELNLETTAADRKMQIFKEPLVSNAPLDIVRTVENLKRSILLSALFSKESTIVEAPYFPLYCFSGFVEKMGRLPKRNEYCTFVAEQWFEYCSIGHKPAIGCRCNIKIIGV